MVEFPVRRSWETTRCAPRYGMAGSVVAVEMIRGTFWRLS